MYQLFLKIIPLALASINSPLMFAIAVFLLTSKDQPFRKIFAFLLGVFVVLAGATFIGYFLGNGASIYHQLKVSKWEDLIIGIVLILLAARAYFAKNEKNSTVKKLGQSLSRSLAGWFAIGFILNLFNFNAVVPYIIEVKETVQANINMFAQILVILFCLIVFALPFLFPVALDLIAPKTAAKILNPLAHWFEKYSKYVVAFFFASFGIYLVIHGLKNL
jgi:cadmium resistance protein CadD (predicted permease)